MWHGRLLLVLASLCALACSEGALPQAEPSSVAAPLDACPSGKVVSNDGVLVCETDEVLTYAEHIKQCPNCDVQPAPPPRIKYDAEKNACVDAQGAVTELRNEGNCSFTDGSCECANFTFEWQREDDVKELRGAVFMGLSFVTMRADDVRFRVPGANLERAVFSKAQLIGADLRGANLKDADLRGAVLAYADLSGANLTGADLTGANLYRAKVDRANFEGAMLLEAKLELQYTSATNDDPKAAATKWGVPYLLNLKNAALNEADLGAADLRYANLEGATLRGASLLVAKADHANFNGADLTGADLRNASLNHTKFKAFVQYANLCHAKLTGAELSDSPMPGTFFNLKTTLPLSAFGAPLVGSIASDVTGVDFMGASAKVAYEKKGLILLGQEQCASLPSPLARPEDKEAPVPFVVAKGGYIDPVDFKKLEYRGLAIDLTHPDRRPAVPWTPGEKWRDGESWDDKRDDKSRVFKNRVFLFRPKPGANHFFVGLKVYKKRIPMGDGAWDPVLPPDKWPCQAVLNHNCLESRDFVYQLVKAVPASVLPSTLWDLYVEDPARIRQYEVLETALTMALYLVPFGATALAVSDHGFFSQQFFINLTADIGSTLTFGATKTLTLGKNGIKGVKAISLTDKAVKPVIITGYALQGPQIVMQTKTVVETGDPAAAALLTMRIYGITKTMKAGFLTKKPTPVTVRYDEIAPGGMPPNQRGYIALFGPDDTMRPYVPHTQRVPGFFDVDAHGDPTGLGIIYPATWRNQARVKMMSTRNIATQLTHHADFQQNGCVGVRLLGCSAGKSESCALGIFKLQKRTVAEELAILTGKPVVAPVETIWSGIDTTTGLRDLTVHRLLSDPPLAKGWRIFIPVKQNGKVVRVDIKWFDWQGQGGAK